MNSYDVVVIGAGPSGSVTARFCALGGAKTLLLDKKKEAGIPLQCGEFFITLEEAKNMFPRVENLEEIWELDSSVIARQTNKINFISPFGRKYTVDFQGIVIHRSLFDQNLVQSACRSGAELMLGTRALNLVGDTLYTNRGEIKSRVFVGADGPFSSVAKWSGLGGPSELAYCLQYTIEEEFPPEISMYFGSLAPSAYGWIIPKEKTANIGLGCHIKGKKKPNLKVLLDKFMVQLGLTGKRIISVTRGAVPVGGPLLKTVYNNVLLVGDAAGFVMAVNGGGVPTGLIAGRVAGKCIIDFLSAKPLEIYEKRWRQAIGKELTTALATKKLADLVFGSDRLTDLSMRILGRKKMGNIVRCKPLWGLGE